MLLCLKLFKARHWNLQLKMYSLILLYCVDCGAHMKKYIPEC